MHVEILKRNCEKQLEEDINEIIRKLMSYSPTERDFTVVKRVDITNSNGEYLALITYGDGRTKD
jgi:hypothetical protein